MDVHVENTMMQDTTHEGNDDAANEANGEVNIVRRRMNNVVNGAYVVEYVHFMMKVTIYHILAKSQV